MMSNVFHMQRYNIFGKNASFLQEIFQIILN